MDVPDSDALVEELETKLLPKLLERLSEHINSASSTTTTMTASASSTAGFSVQAPGVYAWYSASPPPILPPAGPWGIYFTLFGGAAVAVGVLIGGGLIIWGPRVHAAPPENTKS
jgi:hypothetical protein